MRRICYDSNYGLENEAVVLGRGNHSKSHSDFSLCGADLSRALMGKKAANCRAELSQGRVLAAKIEFSYGAGQTVNLLALRLQWFESTPAHTSPLGLPLEVRAIERRWAS